MTITDENTIWAHKTLEKALFVEDKTMQQLEEERRKYKDWLYKKYPQLADLINTDIPDESYWDDKSVFDKWGDYGSKNHYDEFQTITDDIKKLLDGLSTVDQKFIDNISNLSEQYTRDMHGRKKELVKLTARYKETLYANVALYLQEFIGIDSANQPIADEAEKSDIVKSVTTVDGIHLPSGTKVNNKHSNLALLSCMVNFADDSDNWQDSIIKLSPVTAPISHELTKPYSQPCSALLS